MRDNIDFDCSGIFESNATISGYGEQLIDYAVEVASGTLLTSEVLDMRETAISRFERSL
jgi:altronate dehydratase large subunit